MQGLEVLFSPKVANMGLSQNLMPQNTKPRQGLTEGEGHPPQNTKSLVSKWKQDSWGKPAFLLKNLRFNKPTSWREHPGKEREGEQMRTRSPSSFCAQMPTVLCAWKHSLVLVLKSSWILKWLLGRCLTVSSVLNSTLKREPFQNVLQLKFKDTNKRNQWEMSCIGGVYLLLLLGRENSGIPCQGRQGFPVVWGKLIRNV